jgi:hypothetical protein
VEKHGELYQRILLLVLHEPLTLQKMVVVGLVDGQKQMDPEKGDQRK